MAQRINSSVTLVFCYLSIVSAGCNKEYNLEARPDTPADPVSGFDEKKQLSSAPKVPPPNSEINASLSADPNYCFRAFANAREPICRPTKLCPNWNGDALDCYSMQGSRNCCNYCPP